MPIITFSQFKLKIPKQFQKPLTVNEMKMLMEHFNIEKIASMQPDRNAPPTTKYTIYQVMDQDKVDVGHYVLLCQLPHLKTSIYIDSFGVVPPSMIQGNMLKNKMFVSNGMQNINANLCGIYCIYEILQLEQFEFKNTDEIVRELNTLWKNIKI